MHPFIEEVLTEQEFNQLFNQVKNPNHYIGFEISGRFHLGSGVVTMFIVKWLQEKGVNTTIFLADWHSWINKKLGGDIKFIRKVALEYVKEIMIAAAKVAGADEKKINFVLGHDLYKENPDYWAVFMEVGQHTTLARILRSISIMGRKEGENVNFAQLCYPPMQVADIFIQGVHIAHAGMDQRKAHVVARQVAKKITIAPIKNDKGEIVKPVALHHKLVPSLLPPPKWPITSEEAKQLIKSGDMKMSKSKPEGAIFITDTPDQIRQKLQKAFCPMSDLTYNPVAEWIKMFIFDLGKTFYIERPAKYGGNLEIKTWEEFKEIYENGAVHPADVKSAFAEHLIEFLRPAREYLSLKQTEINAIEQEIQAKLSR